MIANEPSPGHLEGPRLEKSAIELEPLSAPTVKELTKLVLIFFGVVIVSASGPAFPAEKTIATLVASTVLNISV